MSLPASIGELGVYDYIVFIVVLVTPLVIGFYHAVTGNKTTEDYLMAGRSMSPVPVAMSLVATFLSSIAILGYVGEVYGHGITLVWALVGSAIGMLVATYVFIPMFYSLHLSSVNEYIELRFKSVFLRRLMLLQNTVSMILYLGMCLFAPTLALETITPYSSETLIVVLGSIVTLYSAFGGLKAVVWTDAFQTSIMVICIAIAAIASLVQVGGFAEVWRIGTEHGRTFPLDLSPDIHKRHTVSNVILMNIVNFMSMYSFGQTTIQRMETMPDIRKVKQVMFMSIMTLLPMLLLLFFTGLCVFAVYSGCDPISLGYIKRKDQIFAFYIMERLSFVKGIPGLFVACLFSGTMSSISSMLNALPTMVWNDLLSKQPYFTKASERVRTLTNKIISFALGLAMIGMAFLATRMGGLIQATSTLLSIISGPTLGIFLVGTCVPIGSKKGAIAGLIASLSLMAWLVIGAQLYGREVTMLPLSTDKCPSHLMLNTSGSFMPINTLTYLNLTSTTQAIDAVTTEQQPHFLAGFYEISYTFLSSIGSAVCIVVAVVVSLITGIQNVEEVDPSLVLPCFKNYVGPKTAAKKHDIKLCVMVTADNDVVDDKRMQHAEQIVQR